MKFYNLQRILAFVCLIYFANFKVLVYLLHENETSKGDYTLAAKEAEEFKATIKTGIDTKFSTRMHPTASDSRTTEGNDVTGEHPSNDNINLDQIQESFKNENEVHLVTTTKNPQADLVGEWLHKSSNVTIIMTRARGDRMGSQFRQLFTLSAFADCNGYNFCLHEASSLEYSTEFGPPICPKDYEVGVQNDYDFGRTGHTEISEPGNYHFNHKGTQRVRFMEKQIFTLNNDRSCLWSKPFKQYWKRKLLQTPTKGAFKNSTTANENLFTNQNHSHNATNIVTIAVHIRRGDITYELRRDKFISDLVCIAAIKEVRKLMEDRGKVPEVHIFSEDYGTINWTAYEGFVDYWHLAPQMNDPLKGDNMDWELNVRDWMHFIKADVLLIGGTFSWMPGSMRDGPDPSTGLPLTFYLCRDRGYFGSRCDDYSFLDLQHIRYDQNENLDLNGTTANVELFGLPSIYEHSGEKMKSDHSIMLS